MIQVWIFLRKSEGMGLGIKLGGSRIDSKYYTSRWQANCFIKQSSKLSSSDNLCSLFAMLYLRKCVNFWVEKGYLLTFWRFQTVNWNFLFLFFLSLYVFSTAILAFFLLFQSLSHFLNIIYLYQWNLNLSFSLDSWKTMNMGKQ